MSDKFGFRVDMIKKHAVKIILFLGILIFAFGMHQANMAKNVSKLIFQAAHTHNWFWADGWVSLLMEMIRQSSEEMKETDSESLIISFQLSKRMTECFSSIREAKGGPDENRIVQNIVEIFQTSEKQAKEIVWISKYYSGMFPEIELMRQNTDMGTKCSQNVINLITQKRWATASNEILKQYQRMRHEEAEYSNRSFIVAERADRIYLISFGAFCLFVFLLSFHTIRQNYNISIIKRKKIEDKLRHSKERYQSLFEMESDALAMIDVKTGNILEVNQAFINLYGYSKEECIQMKNTAFSHEPEKTKKATHELKKIIPVRWHKKKDGSVFPTEIVANIFKYKGKDVHIAAIRDITERQKAEEALRESEAKFSEVFRLSPNAYSLTRVSDGTVIEINNGFTEIFGYTGQEVKGRTSLELNIWTTESDRKRIIDKLLTKGKLKNEETQYRTKDGQIIDALVSSVLIKAGKEQVILAEVMDITDRKLEVERYKKTIESSIDGFWIIDTKGIFLEVNEAYSKMIGYSREEFLKMSIADIEALEHPEEIKKRIEKTMRSGSDRFETKHRHKKGHLIDVEVSATYTKGSGGRFFVFLRDMTARNQIEERLRQAQKIESIGNLAGGIAHDFNNLLFPIIGMSEILLDDLPKDSLEYENVQEIFNAGRRAGDLVKQILAFSRQSEHKMAPMRMQNVLKEVIKLSRSTIPANIEIHENIQQNCGLVMADPSQIHQIAMNLITNAFHAVEEKNGAIDIELKAIALKANELPDSVLQAGQYARLSVSDNGIGMSRDTIQKIFEPYFTTKEQGKGTGLGLAVVYGIVEEHKGEIKIYSEVGKGTTFNIYLPLMEKAIEIAMVDQVSGADTGTENILLVDDEVSVAKLEAQMLSRLGYQLTVKTDSLEALNAFKSDPDSFDLVISDMTMPNMTGDQFAKEILSIKPDTPIIICTGFSERINREQAEIIGVKGFLMKPVVKSDMAQMVRNVLDEVNIS